MVLRLRLHLRLAHGILVFKVVGVRYPASECLVPRLTSLVDLATPAIVIEFHVSKLEKSSGSSYLEYVSMAKARSCSMTASKWMPMTYIGDAKRALLPLSKWTKDLTLGLDPLLSSLKACRTYIPLVHAFLHIRNRGGRSVCRWEGRTGDAEDDSELNIERRGGGRRSSPAQTTANYKNKTRDTDAEQGVFMPYALIMVWRRYSRQAKRGSRLRKGDRRHYLDSITSRKGFQEYLCLRCWTRSCKGPDLPSISTMSHRIITKRKHKYIYDNICNITKISRELRAYFPLPTSFITTQHSIPTTSPYPRSI
ncbi:uncharacterized protein BDR25DRAFT_360879 [Lindgomyces ingoldianus]|uniref:Uncharacterized protein n=1 Tax=Lindgomyces ingoldianus TaxID=673940 RepID=A0ACB6QE35_9PLEO|nr:uncharacterized protein BDR25DRAFT_360879 [Lindgomyces ingoldianus]KAF2465238.1 hypothetical protein BDR25DRAFT_360879 [Lindgomyces ingoldianus]